MFIYKFLTAFSASLVLSATASAAPSISVESRQGHHSVTIELDQDSELAKRFADALIKSPLVTEVVNPWTKPKTVYQGERFTLDLRSNRTIFFMEIRAADGASLTVQNEYLHAGADRGVIAALREALLASTSPHTVTRARPGLICPQEGEVFVLQEVNFGEPSIGCRTSFRNPRFSTCTFELKK